MAFCLRNQANPLLTLGLTRMTWFALLDLAEAYGWNPRGTVTPGYFSLYPYSEQDYDLPEIANWSAPGRPIINRLVQIEDALNLGDALERAFMDYEPRRMPASFFVFASSEPLVEHRPSIGTIGVLAEFCHCGAFWIEALH